MKKYTDHAYADCPEPQNHHKAAHRLIPPPVAHVSKDIADAFRKTNKGEDFLQHSLHQADDAIASAEGVEPGDYHDDCDEDDQAVHGCAKAEGKS